MILKDNSANETLKRVCYLAYNPTTVFGIKKIPEIESQTDNISIDKALDMLEPIYNRDVTGNKASVHLKNILSSLNDERREIIKNIIGRDLRCGIGKRTVSKLWPGLLQSTSYMGAVSFSDKRVDNLFKKTNKGVKIYSETKMDGRYANITVNENGYTITSRNGKFNYFGNIFDETIDIIRERYHQSSFVICGELLIEGVSRFESNGIISSLVSIGDDLAKGKPYKSEYTISEYNELLGKVKMVAWDIVPFDIVDNNMLYKANEKKLRELLEDEDAFSEQLGS